MRRGGGCSDCHRHGHEHDNRYDRAAHRVLPVAAEANYDLTFSPDGQRLYVIQSFGPTVVPVDTATGTVMQPIRLGPPSWSAWGGVFAPGSKTLYVLSYELDYRNLRYLADRMTPIDAATGAIGKPIDIPHPTATASSSAHSALLTQDSIQWRHYQPLMPDS